MKPNYNFFDVMKFMYANEPNNFREFVALTQKRHKLKTVKRNKKSKKNRR